MGRGSKRSRAKGIRGRHGRAARSADKKQMSISSCGSRRYMPGSYNSRANGDIPFMNRSITS